jgi:nicotinamide mononucleotide transporter
MIKRWNFFKDWTLFEKIWLVVSAATLIVLSLLWQDTLLGLVSSVTGILAVVFAAKGKIATFYFGLIQAGTYAYIAYGYGLYGEAMLNAFFYFPTQIIGLILWMRHKKNKEVAVNGEDIYAKRLTRKQWAILIPVTLVAIIGYAFLLEHINAQQVRLDSIAVVLSIVAQTLLMLRFAEQWLLWIIVNVLTIALWFITLTQNQGNDWTILAMWVAFLVNSVYGYLNWRKLSKPATTNEKSIGQKV